MSAQLTPNLPHVVHETIDGETILIHLGTGAYYSLDGTGAEVWQMVLEGVPEDEFVARLKARYGETDPRLVERTVPALVQELVREELLVEAEPPLAHAAPVMSGAVSEGEGELAPAGPFVEPVLHKYTDMQEFMLVDPLHDVEADAGWPHVKAG
jgi:Coenzyme PQQ synthesis protein D (PqqD)